MRTTMRFRRWFPRILLAGIVATGLIVDDSARGDDTAPATPAKAQAVPAIPLTPATPVQPAPKTTILSGLSKALKLAVTPAAEATAAALADSPDASHVFARHIPLKGTDGVTGVQTLCTDPDGRLIALVAPPRGYGESPAKAFGEVHVLEADGTPVTHWKVDFHAQSINASADGSVFVAGNGKLARFDKEGKQLCQVELPHIQDMLKDTDALRARAKEQLEAARQSRQQIVKQYQEQIERIKAKSEEEQSKTEKAQLKQLEAIVKQFQAAGGDVNNESLEATVKGIVGRMRIINSVAVSEEDVFIVCGETQGYGYAVWRMDHNLENPKLVLSKLSGCCGQMDVQVQGRDLLVAENTKHRFARYDREGKELGHWGQRGTETQAGCFGGCCNPMNVRATSGGDVFTAESEGIVKRFSSKGDYLGLVGRVSLTGGCKNVAVAVSPDADQVYFCDQPGSRIIVLAKKPQ